MAHTKRIADLIVKRLDNAITEEENVELESWANEAPANRLLLEYYLQPQTTTSILQTYWQVDEEKVFRNFQRLITQKIVPFWQVLAGSAAAVIVVALSVAYWPQPTDAGNTARFRGRPASENQRLLAMNDQPVTRPTLAVGNKPRKHLDNNKPEETLDTTGYYIFRKWDYRHLAIEIMNLPSYEDNREDSISSTFTVPSDMGDWQLSLPDGSKVVLEPGTSICLILYPNAPAIAQRSIALQGGALFKIISSKENPYRIITNRWDFSVIGTFFKAQDYRKRDSASITLYTGELAISNGNNNATLRERQTAITGNNDKEILIKDETNLLNDIPWNDAFFNFSKDPLPVVMTRVAEWYHINVIYRGELDMVNPGVFRSGVFRKSYRLAEFIKTAQSPDIELTLSNDSTTIIVQRK
ncbi:MAG: FecR domain-containing protein [Bacteroidetes bacterium]|nr:FecR domain-containing protein [Bacteroidota bacterium]